MPASLSPAAGATTIQRMLLLLALSLILLPLAGMLVYLVVQQERAAEREIEQAWRTLRRSGSARRMRSAVRPARARRAGNCSTGHRPPMPGRTQSRRRACPRVDVVEPLDRLP